MYISRATKLIGSIFLGLSSAPLLFILEKLFDTGFLNNFIASFLSVAYLAGIVILLFGPIERTSYWKVGFFWMPADGIPIVAFRGILWMLGGIIGALLVNSYVTV